MQLPEVDGPHSIWGIDSPPGDWKTGGGEPTDAARLERILARDWAARFESLAGWRPRPLDLPKAESFDPKVRLSFSS